MGRALDAPTWQLAAPDSIRLDLFPARVEGLAAVARVIVTDSHYYVLVDSPTGPEPAFSGALHDLTGRNTTGYTVTDANTGEEYDFRRSTSCGCGSRLRGYRPFPGVPLTARLSM